MSTHEQQTSTIPISVVRNTGGKSGPQNLEEPASNEALRELCDKNSKQSEPRYRQESIIMRAHHPEEPADIRRVKTAKGVTGSPNQKGHRSDTYEDDLSQPWTCEERNPFTTRIRHFDFPRTRMPSHVKTYDGQRDGESTEDFMERYKEEVLDVEGAPECMKISGFMHGITHPELIKRLYEKIPRSMDEMYRVTTSFLQGEVAALSHDRKKAPTPWKQPEGGNKPSFKKGFKNKHRSDRKPDRFSLLTKTPKEIFALEKGKFKAPPPMVTPAEKRDPNKYCEFHADTGHKRQAKGTQEGGNGRKRKTTSHPDGPTMGESSQAKGYLEFLSGDNNLFPTSGRQGRNERANDQIIPMECAMISGPSTRPPKVGKILEEKIKVAIHPEYPEQTIAIGSTLTEKGRKELCTLLGQNLDTKEKRGQAPERNKAIQEEVEKLVDAGIMKEVHYHSWLSNPVMVKKHDGSWRMCVDFKDLNKACPQTLFLHCLEIRLESRNLSAKPLQMFPGIAYKGFHQIKNGKGC
ncbi:hypothetical protein Tco_0686391 [Tanacetum coccineum]